jgi:hypothetical protein
MIGARCPRSVVMLRATNGDHTITVVSLEPDTSARLLAEYARLVTAPV